jgi:hypothetical protein
VVVALFIQLVIQQVQVVQAVAVQVAMEVEHRAQSILAVAAAVQNAIVLRHITEDLEVLAL